MRSLSLVGLPSSLLLLISAHVGAENPTAIRKMPPNAGEKLLPDDLSFAEDTFTTPLTPREQLLAARMADDPFLYNASYPYRPPFMQHSSKAGLGSWEHLRRAVEVLHILESRQACPTSTNSCESIGSANKCCMSNEVCVKVEDESVGNIACCPKGASCNGPVGTCPIGTTSCSTSLGGGCCIPGYICQGSGCVPSPPPQPSTVTSTRTATNGGGGGGGDGGGGVGTTGGSGGGGGGSATTPGQTITSTTTSTTTLADGSTTTVVIIVTVTAGLGTVTTTRTTTSTATPTPAPTTTAGSTGGAAPPFRPTSTASGETYSAPFCPTGFYACLARAGGGCCQTGRDCATTSCPPTPSTTIITNGVTVVVPVTDVPEAQATETCAGGWFLCGDEGGPVPGCCPSGYSCGTASCSIVSPSQTGEIQKQFPNSGSRLSASFAVIAGSLFFAMI